MTNQRFSQEDALTYDQYMRDWPGEIDFYRKLAAAEKGQAVLDIACGTGRVALPLARDGARVVGLDAAADMLTVARDKSRGLTNIRWVEGDMRSFELEERFGLVIIPVHSFQFMRDPQEQMACLRCIYRHMLPGGLLVIHNDAPEIDWLGSIQASRNPPLEAEKPFLHPRTGAKIRPLSRWVYSPSTQTCTQERVWEELDADDSVIRRHEFAPMPMHVAFPCEMEHALYRAGFAGVRVLGDFFGQPFTDASTDAIWLARAAQPF